MRRERASHRNYSVIMNESTNLVGVAALNPSAWTDTASFASCRRDQSRREERRERERVSVRCHEASSKELLPRIPGTLVFWPSVSRFICYSSDLLTVGESIQIRYPLLSRNREYFCNNRATASSFSCLRDSCQNILRVNSSCNRLTIRASLEYDGSYN